MKIVVALGAVLALAVPAAAGPLPNGLRGEVREGPTSPVCRTNAPCDRPAAGVLLYFSHAGSLVVTVRTNSVGWYAVRLPAAIYSVKTSRGIRRTPSPARVKVRAGHVDRLDFSIDTGIR